VSEPDLLWSRVIQKRLFKNSSSHKETIPEEMVSSTFLVFQATPAATNPLRNRSSRKLKFAAPWGMTRLGMINADSTAAGTKRKIRSNSGRTFPLPKSQKKEYRIRKVPKPTISRGDHDNQSQESSFCTMHRLKAKSPSGEIQQGAFLL
jgi:hypothetical protein